MQTVDIHRRWLDFFADRGHTVVPSASLISDDPTLMFTIAGMVPFIPYLTGLVPAPYPRAVSVQKCLRTNDIEEVGVTARHGTFFQMCGNFSFGDYFKKEAIAYAWELLTTPEAQGGYGFEERDLWVTVYKDDDESFGYWKEISGLPDHRIQRMGMDSNYWSTGLPGPAGPCSEVFYDRGPAYGAEGGPAADEDRYVEIWNLVFTEYLRGEGVGNDFEILGDLPSKNIDTGMGLERVAFIKQGVENLYEIDQVRPVLDLAAELTGKRYGAVHEDDVRLRVIADHVRSSLMILGDGVTPSNEGRGYVLRRLMRRTVRALRLLGVQEAVFSPLFEASKAAMSAGYPELERDWSRIRQSAVAEEDAFLRTLASGTTILDLAVESTRKSQSAELGGDTAFLLHDTYGFPIDITMEMASEAGLTVDVDAFKKLMTEQRDRAKTDARSKKQILADMSVYSAFRAHGETHFTGYDELETDTSILGLIVDGHSVDRARQGDTAEVILPETTLYAEAGGQEADAGTIVGDGYELTVTDVQRPVAGLTSHRVIVTRGEVAVGQSARTVVDAQWRHGARQAHSGTHLVHAALREILGENAHQSGSYNKAGYLRLDFTWGQALSPATRSEVEEVANNAIRADYEVITREMALSDARELGAMALFGEKYGETVRVVDIGGPWSRELCAGTHVAHSSQIGLINLIGEASVGSSNRRIESLVGHDAFKEFAAERAIVNTLTSSLKTPREQLPDRISELMANLKAANKRIADFEAKALAGRIPTLLAEAGRVGDVLLVTDSLGDLGSVDELRHLVTQVRAQAGETATTVALAGVVSHKPVIIVATNAAAREAGHKAGVLARIAAQLMGGGGGGKDDLAQGGGADVSMIPAALDAIVSEIRG
ncbi:alanine--tRNA ligase [Homoserinimonas sp. OAct 916]|uniref:alanine--tRNA ligase n=1 Tax=Homoserinimonas sp. OAct 916 TaxID=2211450 RepID=UPI000DBE96DD|nr:alanine--tRNA ligase [Homoserinimonas sp. OAct 916]